MFVNVMLLPEIMDEDDKVIEAFGFLEIRIGVTVPIVGPSEFVAVKVAPKQFCCPENVCPQEIEVKVCETDDGIVDCVKFNTGLQSPKFNWYVVLAVLLETLPILKTTVCGAQPLAFPL